MRIRPRKLVKCKDCEQERLVRSDSNPERCRGCTIKRATQLLRTRFKTDPEFRRRHSEGTSRALKKSINNNPSKLKELSEHWKGSGNPNYIDGRTPEYVRARNTSENRRYRERVWERDGYECTVCGEREEPLCVHHTKSFKEYPNLRYDLDNGITVCFSCHQKVFHCG